MRVLAQCDSTKHTMNVSPPFFKTEASSNAGLVAPTTVNGFTTEDAGPGRDGAPMDVRAARRAFRRPRAGRACGMCHSRRVRCDAGSRGVPCTNCEAFSLNCSIPPKKSEREGRSAATLKRNPRVRKGRPPSSEGTDECTALPTVPSVASVSSVPSVPPVPSVPSPPDSMTEDFASLILQADEHIRQQPDGVECWAKLVSPETTTQRIQDPGRVGYLLEQSPIALTVNQPAGAIHFPLPGKVKNIADASTGLTAFELGLLQKRGALSLPPRELCNELVDAYFKWVDPIVPIINRTWFMQRYQDLKDPPPLLLLQAILLAGARTCSTPLLMDSHGSPIPAATLFYNRAKALYDADYEDNRIIIVQALILMGWFWEDANTVTKNVFYWNGLAVSIAHGFGMHRSVKSSRLRDEDKRLWKRIWWTLFTRDRSVAIALGRPPHINMNDADVEMITEEDFIDDRHTEEDRLHTTFFIQYVKLSQIMDTVYLRHYSLKSKSRERDPALLATLDASLARWLERCPREIRWGQSRYTFWSAYLVLLHQTTICLLHRAYLPAGPQIPGIDFPRGPAFQAADSITSIIAMLDANGELRFAPPFIIHILLNALILHIYEVHNSVPGADPGRQISLCMHALDKVSGIWLVARAIQSLFEAILSKAGYGHWIERWSGVGAASASRSTNPSQGPSTVLRAADPTSLPLTPALLAFRDASLASATPSSPPLTQPQYFQPMAQVYVMPDYITAPPANDFSNFPMYTTHTSWDAELQYSAVGMTRHTQRTPASDQHGGGGGGMNQLPMVVSTEDYQMTNSVPWPAIEQNIQNYGVTDWFEYFGMR